MEGRAQGEAYMPPLQVRKDERLDVCEVRGVIQREDGRIPYGVDGAW